MATDKIPSVVSGFGLVDTRLTYWPAQSNADAEGTIPDSLVPQQDTAMALEVHHDSTTAVTDDIKVRTHRPGMPCAKGAGFLHRKVNDSNWVGHEQPSVMTSYQAIDYNTSSDGRINPTVLALSDGVVLMVCDVPTATTTRAVHVHVRSKLTNGWDSGTSLYSETSTSNGLYLYPCLLELPSNTPGSAGRVLLFHTVYDSSRCQVNMLYSDDSGANWTTGALGVLEAGFDTNASGAASADDQTPMRMDAAYLNGQVLLVLSTSEYTGATTQYNVRQYASSDLGCTFKHVTDVTHASNRTSAVVVASRGIFVTAALFGNEIACWRIADAFTPMTVASRISISNTADHEDNTNPMIAIAVNEGGTIYTYYGYDEGVTDTTYAPLVVSISDDGGLSWAVMGSGSIAGTAGETRGKWHDNLDKTMNLRQIYATWHRGRVLIVHNWQNSSAGNDQSIGCITLGGYSEVTVPNLRSSIKDSKRVGWEYTYIPIDFPDQMGTTWTLTSGGSAIQNLVGGKLNMSSIVAENSRYTFDGPSGSALEGMIGMFIIEHTSGIGECRVRNDNGTTDAWEVGIRWTTIALSMYDVNAAAETGSVPIDTTQPIVILWAFRNDRMRAWYSTNVYAGVREWTLIDDASGLTGAGASSGNHRILFGNQPLLACSTSFHMFNFCHDQYTGEIADLTAFLSPGDLYPRAYSSTPIYLNQGVSVSAHGGPTFREDEWLAELTYEYPQQTALPTIAASPARGWRSKTTTADMTLAFKTTEGSEDVDLGSDALFVYMDKLITPDFKVQKRVSGVWATIATIDNRESAPFVRRGSTVVPGVSGSKADAVWFAKDELKGGFFEFPVGNEVRTITGNTEGTWGVGSSPEEKRPVIYLDDDEVDETEATSGTGYIWYPRALVIVSLNGAREATGLRILLRDSGTNNAPGTGYYGIGTLAMGPFFAFGHRVADGTSVQRKSNVQLTEMPDGSIFSRKSGASRRTVQIPMTDTRSVRDVRGTGSPDYITIADNASAEPNANWSDTHLTILDLVEDLDDGRPLVYIPFVERITTAGDQWQHYSYQRCRGAIYGRIQGGTALSHVHGQEESVDVLRGGTITIREEV